MQSPSSWVELHHDRWRWADLAFADFRAELEPDLRSHFPDSRREVSIVLYGPSQTGKSTLLLRLLGVAEGASFAEVERVLRGGRELGQSVTAVATRYHWSHRMDDWELTSRHEATEVLSADELREQLAAVRQSVEAGIDPTGGVPLQIGIPLRYRQSSEPQAWPYILDLPGTNPRNDEERRLAVEAARRYIATAHIVVLVTSINMLTPLRPDVLERDMPPVADWLVAPHRFRIVLTRAVSDAKIRFSAGEFGLEQFRDHVGAQLHAVIETASVRLQVPRSIIFPVEYGASWRDLELRSPLVHRNSQAAVASAFTALTSSLTGTDPDQMRLLTALRARPILAAAAARESTRLRGSLGDADAKVRRAEAHLELVRKRERRATRRSGALSEDVLRHRFCLEYVDHITVRYAYSQATETPTRTLAEQLHTSSRNWFRHASSHAWSQWAAECRDRGVLPNDEEALEFASLEVRAAECFDDTVGCCHQCSERLWPPTAWPKKDPRTCGVLHHDRIPAASRALTAELRSRAQGLIEPPLVAIEMELAESRRAAARWSTASTRAHRRVDKFRSAEQTVLDELSAADERAAVAAGQADELARQLQTRWQQRFVILQQQLAAERDPDMQGFLTAAILLHYRSRDLLKPEGATDHDDHS